MNTEIADLRSGIAFHVTRIKTALDRGEFAQPQQSAAVLLVREVAEAQRGTAEAMLAVYRKLREFASADWPPNQASNPRPD